MSKIVYYIVPIIIIGIIVTLAVHYLIFYISSFHSYGNTVKLISSYMSPQLNKILNKVNNTKTYAVNYTAFNIIYYNTSEDELITVINNVSMLAKHIKCTLYDLLGMIVFYAIYIFFFFKFTYKKIPERYKKIFSVYIPLILALLISIMTASIGYFFIAIIDPILITIFDTLAHLIPLAYAPSIVDTLVFSLDISLVVIGFLIERVFDSERGEIKGSSDEFEHTFPIFNELMQFMANLSILVTKISIVIIIAFSISMSILAYYNIAFLVEYMLFIFSIIRFPIEFALFSLILNTIVYINSKLIGCQRNCNA
ncbi:hypothetical protein [Sulfurisphaera ohwakuensis]|uniref:hypothetical protein n=1 Tax=Sulfurisphaera ohwakuensis TaxID=69656 RepID=UPI0036F3843D